MKNSPLTFIRLSIIAIVLSSGAFLDGWAQSNVKSASDYGKATYSAVAEGQFMRNWLIAGPVLIGPAPDGETQSKYFNDDDPSLLNSDAKKVPPPVAKDGKTYPWIAFQGKEDIVDLDAYFGGKDFVFAYAAAAITSDAEKKTFLAFGSDDGIKVYLNGKLVHNNWVPRGITPDEDLVPVTLKKGVNHLLVKVQDMQMGWGFTAKVLDKKSLSEKLISAAAKGSLDQLDMLLSAGVDVNGKNNAGLTALNAARMHGRGEAVAKLQSKGAQEAPFPTPAALTDNEYNSLKGKKAAGIAVLVAKDGNVLYKNGFGYSDIAKGETITPDTKFRIGSITKQFIGAAILKLQEEGKISTQDKLSRFLPNFPRGNEVTIHHLLTHTSGIHSYTNKNDFITKVTSPISEADLIELITKDQYDFNPGERFLYNNSGYFLLGHIIKNVTGKSFGEFLKDEFFSPIGMPNTGVYTTGLNLSKEAKGYKKENGEYKADIDWDMSWAGGAGALYSTVEDLFKWNEALFNGKVLKPESMKAAFTPVVLNDGNTPVDGKYGYGWFMENYRGHDVAGHGGGLHGFSTRISRYTRENLTVILLTNVLPTEVTLNPNTIAEFFLWEKMTAQTSYAVNAAVTEDVTPYVGRYAFPGGGVMTITAEGASLFAQLTGQSRFPIFPAEPGEYFWKVVEARVKFVKNEKGEVTHGDFSQNGANLKIPKMPDEVIVSIDPALLVWYVGKYDLGNDLKVTVTTENGKLYAQTPTSPKFEIKPVSNTEFTLPELNARLTFVREGNEKAGKFILDQAGQRKDAPRVE